MAANWPNIIANKDSDDTLSSGFTFPTVPSTNSGLHRSSSGLISAPLLSPPLPSHSPRLQEHRSSDFQSSSGSSSNIYSQYFYNNGGVNTVSSNGISSPTGTFGQLSPPPPMPRSVSPGFTSPTLGYFDSHSAPRVLDDALLQRPYYDTPPTSSEQERAAKEPQNGDEAWVRNGWSPRWLRRSAIAAFLGVFAALAVVGEVLMVVLGDGGTKAVVEGLWTFGPVLVTTAVAVLWSRVEFQALQYTPWIILHGRPRSVDETRRKQARRTVLLDYPGMNSFTALSTAFRNRHHLVVASVAGSLLLRVEVVLSTSIFHADVQADGTKYLEIRPGTLHSFVGILCVLCILTLPMLYHAPPKDGITTRDPTSLGGTVAILSSSKMFLSRLTGTGHAEMDVVAARLPGSWYTTIVSQRGRKLEEMFQLKQLNGGPMMTGDAGSGKNNNEAMDRYRPWTIAARAMTATIVASVVFLAGLWVIFAVWGNGEGFDPSDTDFIIWTCIPTLLTVLFAIFLSRIDLDTRRLAPFLKLVSQKCRFRESFGRTYLNEFGLRTVWKSMKHKDGAVFLKKWLAMLGWLMPIFTAGLFAIAELEQTAHLQLQQETYFQSTNDSGAASLTQEVVQKILLNSSPRYPFGTYEDLAFPTLDLVDQAPVWPLPNTDLVAYLTATKAELVCQAATLSNGTGAKLECAPLDSDSETAICKNESSTAGFVAASCSKLNLNFPINYIWGSCADDGLLTVLMCNETINNIDVLTTLRTEDLTIDTDHIPLPNTTSERSANITLGISEMYSSLQDVGDGDSSLEGLDGFFKTLVLSWLDMPLERLVGSDRTNAVSQAIRDQHGMLRAQVLNNGTVRKSFNDSDGSVTQPADVSASVNYFIPRLKQSKIQTVVLAVLFALTLVLAGFALRTVEPCSLPKNPGSIAAQASLLADSTIWWRIPDGAEWLLDEDLSRCLRRKTFRMGWFTGGAAAGGSRTGTLERTYGISVTQDEGKVARIELEGDSMFPGRYISMAPGVYGDIPSYDSKS